jgi:hypothetical protein
MRQRLIPLKALMAIVAVSSLLLAGFIGVNHSWHRLLHSSDSSQPHLCMVCALVKGQVTAAEVSVFLGLLILSLLGGIAAVAPSIFLPTRKYLLVPGRAPPRP